MTVVNVPNGRTLLGNKTTLPMGNTIATLVQTLELILIDTSG